MELPVTGSTAKHTFIEELKFEAGKINDTSVEIIRSNVRPLDMSVGDMGLQISGLRTEQKRLTELCEKYETTVADRAIERLIQYNADYSRLFQT